MATPQPAALPRPRSADVSIDGTQTRV